MGRNKVFGDTIFADKKSYEFDFSECEAECNVSNSDSGIILISIVLYGDNGIN